MSPLTIKFVKPLALVSLMLTLGTTACQQDPLTLTTKPDGGSTDQGSQNDFDGTTGEGGDTSDGGNPNEDACVASKEICDDIDNDCNGIVDDVAEDDLLNDPNHCGACFKRCSIKNALSKCENKACIFSECAPGFHNVNSDTTDGCEYQCLPTNGGKEECPTTDPDCACDGIDNDCDNKIDETFNFDNDVNNCGGCGIRCAFNNAGASCVGGKCKLGKCKPGFANLNGDDSDGCEKLCPENPPALTDPCDGIDNDCDGTVDEDFKTYACGSDVGECEKGTASCDSKSGLIICTGAKLGGIETCNNLDDDCNNVVDNGFDKLNDPRYCGGCQACKIPHAQAKCVSGKCDIAVCDAGWIDFNKDVTDGCEFACTKTGPEICDGIDNDCDKVIDAADSDFVKISINPCLQKGSCAGTTASCHGSYGWVCDYDTTKIPLRPCTSNQNCDGNQCSNNVCLGIVDENGEKKCDGKDDNCNGLTDETFSDKGDDCLEAGKFGICQGSGTKECSTDGKTTICKITAGKEGKPPTHELCNGLDDDCDGDTDEYGDSLTFKGVKDDMVRIKRSYNSKNYDFLVYKYEASRPDAISTDPGFMEHRTCSKSGVQPWANVPYQNALAACQASGKRLCTADEWYLACSGAPSNTKVYPYGDAFVASTCNGNENDSDGTTFGDQDALLTTGFKAQCVSFDGAFDMSGNLREWTNDPQSSGGGSTIDGYTTRGGAYDTVAQGSTCDFTFTVFPPSFSGPQLGFRCCADPSPEFTAPVPGSKLSGASVAFTWVKNGAGAVNQWWIYAGSAAGARNLYNSGALNATPLTHTVTGLPTNGSTIHMELWYRVGVTWQYEQFTYTAAGP